MYVTAQSVDYPRSAIPNMNYETALALKEAGFPQKNCLFYWREKYHTSEAFDKGVSLGKKGIFGDGFSLSHYPYPRYTTADVKWNEADLARLNETEVAAPTLSELIEACGEGFEYLNRVQNTEPPYEWVAGTCDSFAREIGAISMYEQGSSPEIAVANLYLSLHGKKD